MSSTVRLTIGRREGEPLPIRPCPRGHRFPRAVQGSIYPFPRRLLEKRHLAHRSHHLSPHPQHRDVAVRKARPLDPDRGQPVPRLTQVQPQALAAQELMVYGAYSSPLLTVGLELCGRAGEASAEARAQQLGFDLWITGRNGEQRQLNFAALIRTLDRAGALSDLQWWDWARRHRNRAPHPERQSVVTPGMALDVLKAYADGLADFFPREKS